MPGFRDRSSIAVALLCLLPIVAILPGLALGCSPDPTPILSGLGRITHLGLLPGYPWIDPNAGVTVQAIGRLAVSDWLHGRVPWWNPYSGVGLPLAGSAQPAAFFLPFVLLLKVGAGLTALKCSMQIIAGLATFALLRRLGLARLAALSGAILFQFDGTFAWLSDAPILPIAFLPLLLLGLEQATAASGAGRRGGWVTIAIALAYSLYAGFPETAFLDGLFAACYAVQRLSILPAVRWRAFCGKVALGGVVGLLLAAPLLVPLLEFVASGWPGMHAGFGFDGLPLTAAPALLFPYIYGPIFAYTGNDPSGVLTAIWSNIGGYMDLLVLLLAVIGAAIAPHSKGLRLVLAGWVVVILARTFAAPVITPLFAALPVLDLTAVFRYGNPSASFAAIMLAAFAIDDWQRRRSRPGVAVALAVGCALAAIVALVAGKGLVERLLHNTAHYGMTVAASIVGAAAACGAATWLIAGPPTRTRRALLAGLVAVDSIALFAVPTLSGPRATAMDLRPIAFLRQHLGLQRVYTMGPLAPNYGAMFRIAQINHVIMPPPAAWIRFIHATLDPHAGLGNFIGNWPPPLAAREAAFRSHVAGFASAAVRYVLVSPGHDPFRQWRGPAIRQSGAMPRPLGPNESFAIATPPDQARAGTVFAVRVSIGTYGGQASGPLQITLCGSAGCVSGEASLDDAVDNAPLEINLAAPLPVTQGEVLHYTIRRIGGSGPLAIWQWPDASASGETRPDLSLSYTPATDTPKRVFTDDKVAIYELPDPAPYFQSRCMLSDPTRDQVHAVCDQPAPLLRREMFYPGWHATVRGKSVAVTRAATIFQSVQLPAGASDVTFAYRPSYITWAALAAALGALATAAGLLAAVRDRRAVPPTAAFPNRQT